MHYTQHIKTVNLNLSQTAKESVVTAPNCHPEDPLNNLPSSKALRALLLIVYWHLLKTANKRFYGKITNIGARLGEWGYKRLGERQTRKLLSLLVSLGYIDRVRVINVRTGQNWNYEYLPTEAGINYAENYLFCEKTKSAALKTEKCRSYKDTDKDIYIHTYTYKDDVCVSLETYDEYRKTIPRQRTEPKPKKQPNKKYSPIGYKFEPAEAKDIKLGEEITSILSESIKCEVDRAEAELTIRHLKCDLRDKREISLSLASYCEDYGEKRIRSVGALIMHIFKTMLMKRGDPLNTLNRNLSPFMAGYQERRILDPDTHRKCISVAQEICKRASIDENMLIGDEPISCMIADKVVEYVERHGEDCPIKLLKTNTTKGAIYDRANFRNIQTSN